MKTSNSSETEVVENEMVPKLRFQEGEKVLCFHGPLLYEAKCIKAQMKEKQVKYFIHYSGWNKNWDEWVPESRVLKYNDINLQKQKELEKAHLKTKKTKVVKTKKEPEKERSATPSQEKVTKPKVQQSGRASSSSTSSSQPNEQSSTENLRKKRRLDPHVETEAFLTRVEIKVRMPDELKPCLVDDWDLITRQKKLVQLPARITVDQILAEYMRHKTSGRGISPNKESTLQEVTNGIKEYFNVMLGSQLLYKFERPQYAEILSEHPDTSMSQVYGSVHLLRLFVKLGSMLAYTPLDEKSVQLLLSHIHDFLRYLARNSTFFSLSDYIIAPPEYQRKAL